MYIQHQLADFFIIASGGKKTPALCFVAFITSESVKSCGLLCTVFPKVSDQNTLHPNFLLPLLF